MSGRKLDLRRPAGPDLPVDHLLDLPATLLERLGDLVAAALLVGGERRVEDLGVLERSVDVDRGDRHHLEPLVADALELGRDDLADQLADPVGAAELAWGGRSSTCHLDIGTTGRRPAPSTQVRADERLRAALGDPPVSRSAGIRHTGPRVTIRLERVHVGTSPAPGSSRRRPPALHVDARASGRTLRWRSRVGLAAAVAVHPERRCAHRARAIVDALYRAAFAAATVARRQRRARRWNLLIAAGLVAIGSDGWMLVPAASRWCIGFVLAWRDRRDRAARRSRRSAGGMGRARACRGRHPRREPPRSSPPLRWSRCGSPGIASPGDGTRDVIVRSACVVDRRRTGRRARWPRGVLALTQRSTLVDAADVDRRGCGHHHLGPGSGADATSLENEEQFALGRRRGRGPGGCCRPQLVPVVAQNVAGGARSQHQSGAELNAVAAELAASVDYDRPPATRRLDRPGAARRVPTIPPSVPPRRGARAQSRTLAATNRRGSSAPRGRPARGVPDRRRRRRGHHRRGRCSDRRPARRSSAPTAPAATCCCWATPPRPVTSVGTSATGPRWSTRRKARRRAGRRCPTSCSAPAPNPPRCCPTTWTSRRRWSRCDPTRFPQNWGASPDLATVGRLAAELYPQAAGGAPIDGVHLRRPDRVRRPARPDRTGRGRRGGPVVGQRRRVPDPRPVRHRRGPQAAPVVAS